MSRYQFALLAVFPLLAFVAPASPPERSTPAETPPAIGPISLPYKITDDEGKTFEIYPARESPRGAATSPASLAPAETPEPQPVRVQTRCLWLPDPPAAPPAAKPAPPQPNASGAVRWRRFGRWR
jgi:hypothetical protein